MSDHLAAFDTTLAPGYALAMSRRAHIPVGSCALAFLAGLLLVGCADLAPLNAPSPTDLAAAERGADLAKTQCGGCHDIGVDAHHPATNAPDFADIAVRYRNYRLDWELEAISSAGHYRMPRKPLTTVEITDLTAFIRSQDRAPRHP